MSTWICRDDQGPELRFEAETAREAAQEYVDEGDYGQDRATETTWVDVRCTPVRSDGEPEYDETEIVSVAIHPVEPACVDGHEHEWCAPHEVVGGVVENPGVWGHGGGVICKRVCRHCGTYIITDTWPSHPRVGRQDLESVRYEAADDESLAWIARAAM